MPKDMNEQPPAGVPVTSLVWIVVKTRQGQEIRAKRELSQQKFEVYLPMRLFETRKGETIARPLFPSYLFARVTLQVERWKSVYGTLGVAGVLGRPECPIGVKDAIIDRIRQQEEAGFVKLGEVMAARGKLQLGARYRDLDTGIEGVFVEPLDEKRVWLLTRLLGDSRATVDIARLKLIDPDQHP